MRSARRATVRIAKRAKSLDVRIALAQIRSSSDPWGNLFQVQNFYEEARGRKCGLLLLPENVFYRGPRAQMPSEAILSADFVDHPTTDFEVELLDFLGNSELAIVLGSTLTRIPSARLPRNRLWFFGPGAQKISVYDKIHLFQMSDSFGGYDEARSIEPGLDRVVESYGSWTFGFSICYDLRFPELYRHLVSKLGANVLFVPSAFTEKTGEAHWHSLLRSRAIENQSFVLAPGQWGSHMDDAGIRRYCFGNTVAYDSWGRCLGALPKSGDNILVVDLDRSQLENDRAALPALKNIRLPL